MRRLILLLFCLFPLSASALSVTPGGAQTIPFTSGYSFYDGTTHVFSQNFNWQRAQVVAANRIVFLGPIPPAGYPYDAVQITVQPGDQPIVGCMTCHERNEFLEMFTPLGLDEIPGNDEWYGLSLWVPTDFQTDFGVGNGGFFWNIVAQLHGPDAGCINGGSPNFAISLADGEPPDATWPSPNGVPNTHIIVQVQGGDCTTPAINVIDLGTRILGQRIDLVFHANWEIDSTGWIDTYTRVGGVGTLQQVELDGVTPIPRLNAPNYYSISGVPVTQTYWKHGLYRNGGSFNTVYYSGPFIRTNNFHDAAVGAFGPAGYP